ESNPVTVTSLALAARMHAGQFNQILVFRRRMPLHAGVIPPGDGKNWEKEVDDEAIAKAIFRVVYQEKDKPAASATGFFISDSGYFLTPFHVVANCIGGAKDKAELGKLIACDEKHVAKVGSKDYRISVFSHLKDFSGSKDHLEGYKMVIGKLDPGKS